MVSKPDPTPTAVRRWTIHELKTWPAPFADLKAGRKTFEYRLDDRGYEVGDDLLLREWSESSGYSGNELLAAVTHLIRGPNFGVPREFVCMSIKPYDEAVTNG